MLTGHKPFDDAALIEMLVKYNKQTERAKLNMKPIKLPTAREERLRGQLMRYRSEWKLR